MIGLRSEGVRIVRVRFTDIKSPSCVDMEPIKYDKKATEEGSVDMKRFTPIQTPVSPVSFIYTEEDAEVKMRFTV